MLFSVVISQVKRPVERVRRQGDGIFGTGWDGRGGVVVCVWEGGIVPFRMAIECKAQEGKERGKTI